MKQRLILIIKGALLPLVLLGAWQWASGQGAAAAYIFVSLGDLAHSLRDLVLTGELWVHLRASLGRTLAGLLLGGSAGIVTGALMAQSPLADRLIGPLFHSIRQVPLLGLIPLLGLWVGNGDGAKLLVIAIAAFYPTVLNTYAGMRIALSRSWMVLVGAELLAADSGLGQMMEMGRQMFRLDVVMVGVVLTGVIGFGLDRLCHALEARLMRWKRNGDGKGGAT